MELQFKIAIFVAFILRFVLLIYGLHQDRVMLVKYTDIDYLVFTDASEFMLKNQSPYERSTYRYTPVLAYLLQLNHIITNSFGKIMFCVSDLVVTLFFYWTLKNNFKITDEIVLLNSCSCWLFNPFSFVVSSRGNAESLILSTVVASLYFLTKPKITYYNLIVSGILYGFAVHLKIFPIFYCVAIYLFINNSTNRSNSLLQLLMPSTKTVAFFLSALFTLIALTGVFYVRYGQEFLNETYLYHVTRKDLKHNFSPYFYLLYLWNSGKVISLIAFIPQAALLFCISVRYCDDVTFACFVETFVFVSFNKVCTSQYFLWYLGLLPLTLWKINIKVKYFVKLFLLWIFAQGLWLFSAYLLEFLGHNTFLYLWMASLLLLMANSFIIYQICLHYRLGDVKNKYLTILYRCI